MAALDFMTQEKFRAPGYLFADYVTPAASADSLPPLPFDTAGMDTQLKSTRMKELGRVRTQRQSPETTVVDSTGNR